MNTTDEIINHFEEYLEKYDEHKVGDAIRLLLKENDYETCPESMLPDLIAFDFCENYQDEATGWGTYYGPMMVWNNVDGTVTESPSIKRITPEVIGAWEKKANEVKHPILKNRYSDLVWDFSKVITGNNAAVGFAQFVVESAVGIAEKDLLTHDTATITKLERALHIAASINNPALVNMVTKAMMEYEDKVSEDDKPGLWGFSFDNLFANKKVSLGSAEQQKIIDDLERRLENLSSPEEGKPFNPWGAEAAALRLAAHYRKSNQKDEIKRVLLKYGAAFEVAAKDGAPLQVSVWFQKVHSVYLEFGLREDAEDILRKIREVGPKVNSDLKQISHSMEVPREKLDAYVASLIDGDLEHVLAKIAYQYIPRKDETEKQLRDLAKKHPISFLFSRQLQDHKGRPVATIGSLDDDLVGHLVTQISQDMNISSLFLDETLNGFFQKFGLKSQELTDLIFQSPIFEQNKRGIIAAGLKAYFNNDHIIATHLLVPQIEDSIRNLVELTGGSVLKPNRSGGMQLRTFDDILRDECITEVFDEDFSFYLRIFFTDQRGWNIRNSVCHGMCPTDTFQKHITDRLIHAFICLAQVQEKKQETA